MTGNTTIHSSNYFHSSTSSSSADEAYDYILKEMFTNGQAYDFPIFQLYTTTIGIIVIIHCIFIHQVRRNRSRQDVVTSYRNIVLKKKFHQAVLAILSHPSHIAPQSAAAASGTIEINMGHDDHEIPFRDSPTSRTMYTLFVRGLRSILRQGLTWLNWLLNGPFSGLPLLAYISHILWQCRPLEEIYDYTYDRISGLHRSDFNMAMIHDADKLLLRSFQNGRNHNNKLADREDISFRYSRVLVALAFVALCIQLFVTHVFVMHLNNRERLRVIADKLMDKEYCTLTSLATALLIVYTNHFPYTPMSALPLLDTSMIGVDTSSIGFILNCGILSLLSYRLCGVSAVLYGTVSGLLWINGYTKFLATCYWGNWLVGLMTLSCLLSIKVQSQREENLRQMHGSRSRMDWVPFIDAVAWDDSGRVANEEEIMFTFSAL